MTFNKLGDIIQLENNLWLIRGDGPISENLSHFFGSKFRQSCPPSW